MENKDQEKVSEKDNRVELATEEVKDLKREQEKASGKTFKVRPSTEAVIEKAKELHGGSTDELLFSLASRFIESRNGETLSISSDVFKSCITQFEANQSFQMRLLCTTLEQANVEKSDIIDRYERLVKDAETKATAYRETIKRVRAEEESARSEAESLGKEAAASAQRVKDLEDKLSVMEKASELSEKSIKDLSVQLASASEKSSMYDALMEAIREKDTHIRDLEEQVRMLQKDLEHEKDSAAQRIRIIELEAEKKIEEAAKKSVEEDLPFN